MNKDSKLNQLLINIISKSIQMDIFISEKDNTSTNTQEEKNISSNRKKIIRKYSSFSISLEQLIEQAEKNQEQDLQELQNFQQDSEISNLELSPTSIKKSQSQNYCNQEFSNRKTLVRRRSNTFGSPLNSILKNDKLSIYSLDKEKIENINTLNNKKLSDIDAKISNNTNTSMNFFKKKFATIRENHSNKSKITSVFGKSNKNT